MRTPQTEGNHMPNTPGKRIDIERLTRRMGKYALVVAVSQRARELKERARFGEVNVNQSNLIARALREISEGRVKLLETTEEPE